MEIHPEYGAGPAHMAICDMRILVVASFFNPLAHPKPVIDSLWAEAHASGIAVLVVDDYSSPPIDLQAYNNHGYYPVLQIHRNSRHKGTAACFHDAVRAYTANNRKIAYAGMWVQGQDVAEGQYAAQARQLDDNPQRPMTAHLQRVTRALTAR